MPGISFLSIMIMIFIAAAGFSGEEQYPESTMLGLEYRHDVIDYDKSERDFFRERISIGFSSLSSFNFTHITMDDKERRYTWNLKLHDLSEHAKLIFGNFQAGFGAGLLMGKKMYISSNPFLSPSFISKGGPFSAANSGNPQYSFNGIAGSFLLFGPNIKFSLNPFYSMRQRYIDVEDFNAGYVSSSLTAINQKLKREGVYNEPVIIHDTGIMAGMNYLEVLTFQIYYFQTGLQGPDGGMVRWDYADNYGRSGLESYRAWGFYSRYSDGYFLLYFELGMSDRIINDNDGPFNGRSGFGLIYGTAFRHPFFNVSISGKEMDKNFFTLYSSGKDYPERYFVLDESIRPLEPLLIGSSISSSKRISPGIYDYSLPSVKREVLFLTYFFSRDEKLDLNAGRIDYDGDEEKGERRQAGGSLNLKFFKFLDAGVTGEWQRANDAGQSWEYSAGSGIKFLYYFSFRVNYSRLHISEKNYLYSKKDDDIDSISGWSLATQSQNRLAGRFMFKYNKNYFFLKYENCYIGLRSLRKRIEFIGKIVF